MPIDYKKYPPNWKTEIRPAILERAKNCCEQCRLRNYTEGFRNKDGYFYSTKYVRDKFEYTGRDMFDDELSHCLTEHGQAKPIKIVLTIAHLDHDIQNNDYSNLKALCQRCHNRHDKEYRQANRKETVKKKKGQTTIFN